MEFTNEPYDMVDNYLDLCSTGGLIIPLYLTDHDKEIFRRAADIKGMTLVEYLNSCVPRIEELMQQVIQDYKDSQDQEMNV